MFGRGRYGAYLIGRGEVTGKPNVSLSRVSTESHYHDISLTPGSIAINLSTFKNQIVHRSVGITPSLSSTFDTIKSSARHYPAGITTSLSSSLGTLKNQIVRHSVGITLGSITMDLEAALSHIYSYAPLINLSLDLSVPFTGYRVSTYSLSILPAAIPLVVGVLEGRAYVYGIFLTPGGIAIDLGRLENSAVHHPIGITLGAIAVNPATFLGHIYSYAPLINLSLDLSVPFTGYRVSTYSLSILPAAIPLVVGVLEGRAYVYGMSLELQPLLLLPSMYALTATHYAAALIVGSIGLSIDSAIHGIHQSPVALSLSLTVDYIYSRLGMRVYGVSTAYEPLALGVPSGRLGLIFWTVEVGRITYVYITGGVTAIYTTGGVETSTIRRAAISDNPFLGGVENA